MKGLRILRQREGISQEELAKRLGGAIKQSRLSLLEHGLEPHPWERDLLYKFFGVSPDRLRRDE